MRHKDYNYLVIVSILCCISCTGCTVPAEYPSPNIYVFHLPHEKQSIILLLPDKKVELQREKLKEVLIVQPATPNRPRTAPYQHEDGQYQSPINTDTALDEKPESKKLQREKLKEALIVQPATPNRPRTAPYQHEDGQYQSPINTDTALDEKPESKKFNFILVVGAGLTILAIGFLTKSTINVAMKHYKSRGKKGRKVRPIRY